jgi:uncharacterized repeat protein (TIGR03803 family)
MSYPKPRFTSMLRRNVHTLAWATLLVCVLRLIVEPTAQAQSFSVLHSFAPNRLGYGPYAGLIQDARGGLYGTTNNGDAPDGGVGSVYKLTHAQSGWTLTALVEFNHDGNGYGPQARLTLGPDGAMYGTTVYGGYPGGCGGQGCGTIFRLSLANFSRTVIYRFSDSDGYWPLSEVTFDSAGNLFGTAVMGGAYGGGTVFELVRNGNQWTHSDIYTFTGASDGGEPVGGLIIDSGGNLYGTTVSGGTCACGVVFELSPLEGGWSEQVLHNFDSRTEGGWPEASLIMDAAGNLYGTASAGGSTNGGTVFELSPSGNTWNFTLIYALVETGYPGGGGPRGSVLMDAAGKLYGTTYADGAYVQGSVFELTPTNGQWAFISLHDFDSLQDGEYPVGNLLMDANGNLFGTTLFGGQYGVGTVWEITP